MEQERGEMDKFKKALDGTSFIWAEMNQSPCLAWGISTIAYSVP